jgi:hypothetical protein
VASLLGRWHRRAPPGHCRLDRQPSHLRPCPPTGCCSKNLSHPYIVQTFEYGIRTIDVSPCRSPACSALLPPAWQPASWAARPRASPLLCFLAAPPAAATPCCRGRKPAPGQGAPGVLDCTAVLQPRHAGRRHRPRLAAYSHRPRSWTPKHAPHLANREGEPPAYRPTPPIPP